jgi:intracellular septation protein
MKLILDFLPIALFFGVFLVGDANPAWAAAFATSNLGFLVSGGVVGEKEAPVVLATVVVMVATGLQIAFLKLTKRPVEWMLWISFVLVVGFGGATIYLHNETFIKLKPTVLYVLAGGGLLLAQWLFRKNGIRALMQSQMKLPDTIWTQLNTAWGVFFIGMGALNLWVAQNFSTATWAKFKLFGIFGLMIAFAIGQAIYLSRHMSTETPDEAQETQP